MSREGKSVQCLIRGLSSCTLTEDSSPSLNTGIPTERRQITLTPKVNSDQDTKSRGSGRNEPSGRLRYQNSLCSNSQPRRALLLMASNRGLPCTVFKYGSYSPIILKLVKPRCTAFSSHSSDCSHSPAEA